MKSTIPTNCLLLFLTSGFLSAQNSFNDYSGWTDGQLTGNTTWAGFGTLTSTVTLHGDADGITPGGVSFPLAGNGQGDLAPFGPELTAARALTFLASGTSAGNAFTDLNVTFSGGAFPTESVIYLTDNDVEAVIIEAFLNSVPVDVSGWYVGNVQTNSNGTGTGSGFDPLTGTTIPSGSDAEFFVQQFQPDTAFDELVITNTNTGNGRIGFNIGNVVVAVPEPSSSLLVALSGLGLLARRRR